MDTYEHVNKQIKNSLHKPSYAIQYEGYYLVLFETDVGELWRVQKLLESEYHFGGDFYNKESAKDFVRHLNKEK